MSDINEALSVLRAFPKNALVVDLYDDNADLSGALNQVFGDSFEYPDFSHRKMEEVVKLAERELTARAKDAGAISLDGVPLNDPARGDSPLIWSGSQRWTLDRGAMPGEPFAYLDGNDENSVAAMFEIQSPGKPEIYEVRKSGGILVSQSDFPHEAARVAEEIIGNLQEAPIEKAGFGNMLSIFDLDLDVQMMHEVLVSGNYFVGKRDPSVNPEFPGAYMVNDILDAGGYAIVGDDLSELILEAHDHLLSKQNMVTPKKLPEPQELSSAEFAKAVSVEKLVNHGRGWEVFYGGEGLGFADGPTRQEAINEVHKRSVNNAIYYNSPDGAILNKAAVFPPDHVMAEYPDLKVKFAEVFEDRAKASDISAPDLSGVEVVSSGSYFGAVEAVTASVVVQNAGRGRVVGHEVGRFGGVLPAVGDTVDLTHKDGKVAFVVEKDKGNER